jgi:CDP-diacylglycerol---serine O-phosphatidyltransferase
MNNIRSIVQSPILQQLDLPNILTLVGLLLSFFSVIFSIQEQFYIALLCILYAGIIDLFDGFIARQMQRSELRSEVGQQLDSIVDLCSFGFAPAVFAYCFGLRDLLSLTVLIGYLEMNALRLAYFNSTGLSTNAGNQYFTGLPVTYAAMFIPLTMIVSFILPDSIMRMVLNGLYFLLAIAMISGIKVLKLRGIWYGICSLGAIALTGIYLWFIITGR